MKYLQAYQAWNDLYHLNHDSNMQPLDAPQDLGGPAVHRLEKLVHTPVPGHRGKGHG